VNIQSIISSAHQADDAGDLAGCVNGYTRALSIQRDIVAAYAGRARCYSEQGNPSAAVQDYSQAVRLSPNDPELLLQRGDAEQQLGNKSAAASDYKAVPQNSSASPSQIVRAAQGLYGIRFYPDALSILDRAVLKYGTYWALHEYRAVVEIALSNDAVALDEFEKAARLAVGADLAQVMEDRGNFYLSRQRYQQAVSDYSRAVQLDRGRFNSFQGRAQARQAIGDLVGAETDFGSAIEIYKSLGQRDPDVLASLLMQRGQLYLSQGSKQKALADFKQALEISRPSNRAQRDAVRTLINAAGG